MQGKQNSSFSVVADRQVMLNGDNDESLALSNDSAAELSTDTLLSVASSKVGISEIALERRSEAIDSPTPEENQDNQPITGKSENLISINSDLDPHLKKAEIHITLIDVRKLIQNSIINNRLFVILEFCNPASMLTSST
jgi:hypothetical protein